MMMTYGNIVKNSHNGEKNLWRYSKKQPCWREFLVRV